MAPIGGEHEEHRHRRIALEIAGPENIDPRNACEKAHRAADKQASDSPQNGEKHNSHVSAFVIPSAIDLGRGDNETRSRER
jgi:hypothetical protein